MSLSRLFQSFPPRKEKAFSVSDEPRNHSLSSEHLLNNFSKYSGASEFRLINQRGGLFFASLLIMDQPSF